MHGRSIGEGLTVGNHRHRIPLGLVMLEQGWITSEQLRKAIEAQRSAGEGRVGDWLVSTQGVPEQLVTRALSLQWSCPVLPLDRHDPEQMAAALPRLFVEAFGVLPLRVAAGSILYCGFEDRLDPALALAAERISGLRVESGLVRGSLFQTAHARMLTACFPRAELVEASSESPLVRALTKFIERTRPVESKLVRVTTVSGCGCGPGPRLRRCRKAARLRMSSSRLLRTDGSIGFGGISRRNPLKAHRQTPITEALRAKPNERDACVDCGRFVSHAKNRRTVPAASGIESDHGL